MIEFNIQQRVQKDVIVQPPTADEYMLDALGRTRSTMYAGYGEVKRFTSDTSYDGTQALITAAGDLFIKQNFTK